MFLQTSMRTEPLALVPFWHEGKLWLCTVFVIFTQTLYEMAFLIKKMKYNAIYETRWEREKTGKDLFLIHFIAFSFILKYILRVFTTLLRFRMRDPKM